MYWVTRYEDVRAVLIDSDTFVTGTSASLLFDVFGEHMLTTDGALHRRYRGPALNGAFMPQAVRSSALSQITRRVDQLINGFIIDGHTELRSSLAARLPILTMLDIFGLPEDIEPHLRTWYDAFEAALSNHAHDPAIRDRAKRCVAAFHDRMQDEIEACRAEPRPGLLQQLLMQTDQSLSDPEIRRNALIIMFGGISTVEAVILNTLWALLAHPAALSRVIANRALLDAAFDETMRWISPVQSATRHTLRDAVIGDVSVPAGTTVNCMLASANRDEAVFAGGDVFNIDRANARKQLGFATGPHLCLGRHLAREEMRVSLNALFDRAPTLRLSSSATRLAGHEFRQPSSLSLNWD
ncbi:cytochrome P450 [Candidatus Viadribacter manganicus]|nr:cytochrome P450 [Candidatus Viadribacter manganicus]